jgi:hypothetical protein
MKKLLRDFRLLPGRSRETDMTEEVGCVWRGAGQSGPLLVEGVRSAPSILIMQAEVCQSSKS